MRYAAFAGCGLQFGHLPLNALGDAKGVSSYQPGATAPGTGARKNLAERQRRDSSLDRDEPDGHPRVETGGAITASLREAAEFGHLTKLGRAEAKGLTHSSPGQRPGRNHRIFIESQRPVSYLTKFQNLNYAYAPIAQPSHCPYRFQHQRPPEVAWRCHIPAHARLSCHSMS